MQYRGKGKHDYLRRVEFAFYNEAAIRQAVREKRLDRGTKAAGARGGFSDPTASAAISAATPIRCVVIDGRRVGKPETWLKVVDKTYEHLEPLHRGVIRDRYLGRSYQETCIKRSVSQAIYSRIVSDARMFAASIAAQYGLIKIVD